MVPLWFMWLLLLYCIYNATLKQQGIFPIITGHFSPRFSNHPWIQKVYCQEVPNTQKFYFSPFWVSFLVFSCLASQSSFLSRNGENGPVNLLYVSIFSFPSEFKNLIHVIQKEPPSTCKRLGQQKIRLLETDNARKEKRLR